MTAESLINLIRQQPNTQSIQEQKKCFKHNLTYILTYYLSPISGEWVAKDRGCEKCGTDGKIVGRK